MELLRTVISLILGCLVLYLILNEYLRLKNDRKNIDLKLESRILQTDDIRIESMVVKNVVGFFGNEFDYCKFYFVSDEIYLKFRQSFPDDMYSIPLVLKKSDGNNYSYFSSFNVTKFEPKGTQAKIHFKNKTIIGSNFKLNLKDISEDDMQALKKNLCYSAVPHMSG